MFYMKGTKETSLYRGIEPMDIVLNIKYIPTLTTTPRPCFNMLGEYAGISNIYAAEYAGLRTICILFWMFRFSKCFSLGYKWYAYVLFRLTFCLSKYFA